MKIKFKKQGAEFCVEFVGCEVKSEQDEIMKSVAVSFLQAPANSAKSQAKKG